MPGPNPPRSDDWYRVSDGVSTRWLVVGGAVVVSLVGVIVVISMTAGDPAPAPVTTIAQ